MSWNVRAEAELESLLRLRKVGLGLEAAESRKVGCRSRRESKPERKMLTRLHPAARGSMDSHGCKHTPAHAGIWKCMDPHTCTHMCDTQALGALCTPPCAPPPPADMCMHVSMKAPYPHVSPPQCSGTWTQTQSVLTELHNRPSAHFFS